MIVLDTNVFVALLDPHHQLHSRSKEDAGALAQEEFFTTGPVLAETCQILGQAYMRTRLRALLIDLEIKPYIEQGDAILWPRIFEWLERYGEHEPDWIDAQLVILSEENPSLKIWTYDREFYNVWRRLDGSIVPMAVARVA